MRALTANVFITRSLPAMDKLFFASEDNNYRLKTFDQRLKTLSKTQLEQSFIASPLRNDGLMDLEMSVTANGNASQGKGQTVTMRFLETSKLLELFLLENDPLSEIISAREEEFKRMRDPGQSTNIKNNPLSKSTITDRLSRTNRYYLAFGTGSNVKDWSGPFTLQLGGASLKNDSNNVRIIELVFVPDLESYRSWSPKFGSILGYNDNFQNASQFVSEDIVQTAKSSMYINGCEGKIYNLDHRLRVLLKRYISTFTKSEGNAIVVLPDKFGKLEVAIKPVIPQPQRQVTTYKFFEGIFENYSDFVKTGVRLSKFSIKDVPDQISPLKDGLNYLQDIGLEAVDKFKQLSLNAKDLATKALNTLQAGGNTAKALKDAFKDFQEKKKTTELNRIVQKFERGEVRRADQEVSYIQILNTNTGRQLMQLTQGSDLPELLGAGTPLEIVERVKLRRMVNSFLDRPESPGFISFTNAEEVFEAAYKLQLENDKKLSEIRRDTDVRKANSAFEQAMKPRSPEFNKFLQEQEQNYINATNFTEATVGLDEMQSELIRLQNEGMTSRPSPKTLAQRRKAADQIRDQLLRDEPLRAAKLEEINYEANWDLTTESARTLFVTRDKNIALQMFIELKNLAAQEVYDGFSPMVAPLIKFASGIKSATKQKSKTSQYDFLEENDIRLLRLWKKYGIIEDATKPAFIYGNTGEIRKLLYPEGDTPSDHLIQTVVTLEMFDDLDGKDESGRVKSRRREGSGIARAKYKQFVADFRREFPQPPKLFLRHNDKNANVLALNYNIDKYQAVLLNLPVSPSLDKGYIGTSRVRLAKAAASQFVSESVKNALSKVETPTFTEFVTEMTQSYRGAASFDLAMNLIESDNFEAVKNKNMIDLLSVLFFVQNVDSESFGNAEKLGKEFGVTKNIDANSLFDQYYQAILDQTMKLLYNCNVRTYPMFNEKVYFKRACRLDGNTGGIIGFPEKLRYDAPYNGDYTVLGFKHVISTNNIYTEFDLVRQGMEHKFASTKNVKVKDFFCKILWDNLGMTKEEYINKFVDVKFNEVPTDSSVGAMVAALAAKVSNAFGLGNLFQGAELGLSPQEQRRNYYKNNGFINERFERIEKALKTMGCI